PLPSLRPPARPTAEWVLFSSMSFPCNAELAVASPLVLREVEGVGVPAVADGFARGPFRQLCTFLLRGRCGELRGRRRAPCHGRASAREGALHRSPGHLVRQHHVGPLQERPDEGALQRASWAHFRGCLIVSGSSTAVRAQTRTVEAKCRSRGRPRVRSVANHPFNESGSPIAGNRWGFQHTFNITRGRSSAG